MRRHHSSSLSMNDMLFNVLLGFVMLFVIAFLLIQPPTKKADIPSKAEFIIMIEWPKDLSSDVDLWVQYEQNAPVGFSNKQEAPLHLDRDDLGDKNDIVIVNGKRELILQNREMTTVRGIAAGSYYVGIHLYHYSDVEPVEVTVTVFDINPYVEIYRRVVTLTETGQKANLPGFTINEAGNRIDAFEHNRNLGPNRPSGGPTGL